MGWESVPNTSQYLLRNLWGGWFPNRVYNDIPGTLDDQQPTGATDCDYVVWYNGALQKMFGYSKVTTSALNSGAAITSLFYSEVLDDWVCTAGDAVFGGADGATPTDITSTLTITAGTLMDWTDWDFEGTTIAIGTNQADPPIKWTGSGNAALLGGTPPQGRWIERWQDVIWLANTASEPSTLFFSNIGDPETWTTDDDYKFDAPITGLKALGKTLVVFMEDHIGVLFGDNNRQLRKIDRYINSVGCSGGHTVRQIKFQGEDALMFHAYDGWHIFNGSTSTIKVSHAIANKYTGFYNTSVFNQARFNQAWAVYHPKLDWYLCGLADGADTTNLFGMVIDLARPYQLQEGPVVPHWPMSDPANAFSCLDVDPKASLNSSLYFGSTDGNIYKFETSVFNHNSTSYTGFYTSKFFDMQNTIIVQEVDVLGETQESSSSVDVFIATSLEDTAGTSGSVQFQGGADQLDIDFILDTSTLGGSGFSFKHVPSVGFGRFLRFKIQNDTINEPMAINQLALTVTSIGVDSALQT